jgi:hypothetical protein
MSPIEVRTSLSHFALAYPTPEGSENFEVLTTETMRRGVGNNEKTVNYPHFVVQLISLVLPRLGAWCAFEGLGFHPQVLNEAKSTMSYFRFNFEGPQYIENSLNSGPSPLCPICSPFRNRDGSVKNWSSWTGHIAFLLPALLLHPI